MNAPLTIADRRRIERTAALMDSDQDGEALGAVRALGRLLDRHGLKPADVVRAGLGAQPFMVKPGTSSPPTRADLRDVHRMRARMCLAYPGLLDEWERDFLGNIAVAARISDKQRQRLAAIFEKIGRVRDAA